MTKFYRLLLPLLLGLFLATSAAAADMSGKVTWIFDGDTIKVSGIGSVRLIGIDAPEKDPTPRDNYYMKQGIKREQLRQVSAEALEFLIANVKGKTVTLKFDRQKRDRHDRLLAYVYLPDGTLLNRLLVRNGMAAVYRKFEFRKKNSFLRVEAKAKKAHLGLWQ